MCGFCDFLFGRKDAGTVRVEKPSASDESLKNGILLQLHEQYAVNNNAALGNVMGLVVVLLAAVGAWAYVLVNIHTGRMFGHHAFFVTAQGFTPGGLLLASLGAEFVALVIFALCVYQGVAQRLEQFVIYSLRRRAGLSEGIRACGDVFPESYTPFGKKGFDVVQGIFGLVARCAAWLFFGVFVVGMLVALTAADYSDVFVILMVFVVYISVSLTLAAVMTCCFGLQLGRYRRRAQEYSACCPEGVRCLESGCGASSFFGSLRRIACILFPSA